VVVVVRGQMLTVTVRRKGRNPQTATQSPSDPVVLLTVMTAAQLVTDLVAAAAAAAVRAAVRMAVAVGVAAAGGLAGPAATLEPQTV
jgi:hypothetical protein